MPTFTDYKLSRPQAEFVQAVALMPADLRAVLVEDYAARHGIASIAALFVEFVGLANSVARNCAQMSESLLIENGMHPHTAEKINLPTIFGAAAGALLALPIKQRGTCQGCAYRRGTPANQSPVTTCDADHAVDELVDFMCHEKLDAGGRPVRVCAGHAQRVKAGASLTA
ncbi:hypothetical protein [Herbaspirillum sp. NPDC101397]|uniref:hypothetical protein n=1 Tax=Herbaspirillum sp. NPDC101397 TaxID=3364006 RepID=UPI00383BDD03